MKWLLVALALMGCSATETASTTALSVVELSDGEAARCSGVVVARDAIATARHCVESGIVFPGFSEVVGTATDPEADIAIVRIRAVEWPAATLGEPTRDLSMIGFGCSGYLEETEHTFMRTEGDEIVSAGRVCRGDSGGGLFNHRGELVAIHSLQSGHAYSVRVELLRGMLAE